MRCCWVQEAVFPADVPPDLFVAVRAIWKSRSRPVGFAKTCITALAECVCDCLRCGSERRTFHCSSRTFSAGTLRSFTARFLSSARRCSVSLRNILGREIYGNWTTQLAYWWHSETSTWPWVVCGRSCTSRPLQAAQAEF